ncbi:hypothetical protein AB0I75_32500 [Streptomyces sp. NPDC050273]|uniref:hypothetical protein n=1 Tax=Streptomyces sp. NPDC050273 TaxID=3154933 RepID=UPI00343B0F92
MNIRRALGAGPETSSRGINAAQADLSETLPGIRLPDLQQLRGRGVLRDDVQSPPTSRRALGPGRAAGKPEAPGSID